MELFVILQEKGHLMDMSLRGDSRHTPLNLIIEG